MPQTGILYVCATPIGNLRDITLRVLETLKAVDFIAAEDTRHTKKLLDHYHIKTPLLSYHDHNEKSRAEEIVHFLKEGKSCALVSDAGMPGISDPGHILITCCQEEKICVDVLPGANAALTALVLSGMPAENFLFLGFLPSTKTERKKILREMTEIPYTIILYEAPHRIKATLEDILEILGDRQTAVTRELTKLHQTVHRGLTSELLQEFRLAPVKGECCIILAPAEKNIDPGDPSRWMEDLREIEKGGRDRKEAMKMVAKKYGMSKSMIYKAFLEQK
ncbi:MULTISPECIES: 16S rRNA (cytidine(1402)-2'-O)-methyltransferase [unclassified Dehalobacter]|uniref:16S rRNA (cytidine(1402)-2'-O)-methyltransferase n=1 Tax=unclassified Dehalobacter TaxID=2635733 RepID=UPI000E6B9943|nr:MULTISPECIES: 16S rRNA (cytidine(1402)-2'-O)-methyltransferase [unclassified Dehalobacter]RJE47843.1 16S rRNA (cytidine(1402)-2'-O)-methyltransferase [Dehalobacter sp. MCB1]TCX49005.1 16S rRNA (cytidine(1402)-2'-O)-methyltransferase [Dehalobacter sp. 14DCB1]TCX56673.1 16S rRNA (cytidine(1402)-2'-O)-methyltransferase [Dehalobacter sp. 12DCB1]